MHSIWSGAISFGLVNIPVKLYSGSQDHELHFTMLHKKDHSPIRYLRVCKKEGKEVPYKDIVKGYEYQKDQFVVLDEKDFERADPVLSKTVEIVEFVDEAEIDTRLYQKPYYLEPVKADKPYNLLYQALLAAKKVAIAHVVLRNKEHLAVLKAMDNVLVLNLIRFESELIKVKNLNLPEIKKIETKEMNMALALIKQLTHPFKPEEFKNTYVNDLEKVIAAKISGKKPTKKTKVAKETFTDLMSTLQASLAKESKKHRVATREKPSSKRKRV